MKHPNVKGLFIVWIILTIVHLWFYHAAIQAKVSRHAALEMQRIEKAVGIVRSPQDLSHSHINSTAYVDAQAFVLSLPLLPLFTESESATAPYPDLLVPIKLRVLNSLLAALLVHMCLIAVTSAMPGDYRLKRFIHGKNLSSSDGIPRSLDRVPLFAIARFLSAVQNTRYGTFAVVGSIHFLFSCLTFVVQISVNLGGGWAERLYIDVMRFPLTPLIVGADFWQAQHLVPAVKLIFCALNSLIVGTFVGICFELLHSSTGKNQSTKNNDKP